MSRKRREGATESRLKQGARVMKTLRGGQTEWSFAEDGQAARSDIVERLIRDGVLAPMNDGLFGDSQTYGVRP